MSGDADHLDLLRHRHPHVSRRSPATAFHASYQGFEAFVAIETGEIVAGGLPNKAARLVIDFESNIRNKLARGKFTAVFLIQCLQVIGASSLHVSA